MHRVIKYMIIINIEIDLFLEDFAFSMVYTKFLIRYYIGSILHFTSEFYKIIKNPNHKLFSIISPIFNKKKINAIDIEEIDNEKPDCEHCKSGYCDEHGTYKDDFIQVVTKPEKPIENIEKLNTGTDAKVKPIFNSEIINDDILTKYTPEEIAEAKKISSFPELENDINKINKAISITEDILVTLQDKEIHYDNIGKLNKLMIKVNNLYNRAKELQKIEHLKKKREIAESLIDDFTDDEVVNK